MTLQDGDECGYHITLRGKDEYVSDKQRLIPSKILEAIKADALANLNAGETFKHGTIISTIRKYTDGHLYETNVTNADPSNPRGTAPAMSDDELHKTAGTAQENSHRQDGNAPKRTLPTGINPLSGDNIDLDNQSSVPTFSDDFQEPPPKVPKLADQPLTVGDFVAAQRLKHHDCPSKPDGCPFTTTSEALLIEHYKNQCDLNPSKKNGSDILSNKYSALEITRKDRTIVNEKDDNNMLLVPSRCWSLPANHLAHQTLAVRGQKDFLHWNYNTDRLGVIVRNKKLMIEMHDTSNTDLELKLFTK